MQYYYNKEYCSYQKEVRSDGTATAATDDTTLLGKESKGRRESKEESKRGGGGTDEFPPNGKRKNLPRGVVEVRVYRATRG